MLMQAEASFGADDACMGRRMSRGRTSSDVPAATKPVLWSSCSGCDVHDLPSVEVDMELRSNASTRAPSPSTRSQNTSFSKLSFETSSLGLSFETSSLGPRIQDSVEEEVETTFMIRSLPPVFSRTKLEELLDSEGFTGKYDFLYLPTDLKAKDGGCFGYAFVNLISVEEASLFQDHFHGYQWSNMDLEPMGVHASEALQGLDELIERYRNSPLMHKKVDAGLPPTVRLRPLRVRGSTNRKQPGSQEVRPRRAA